MTSQAVCAGGAPSAAPIGTNATAIMAELMGFSTDPRTIGAISRRSKESAGRGREGRSERTSPDILGITAG